MSKWKGRSYKGRYAPKNPHKWEDPGRIVYRSGIELQYFNYFDTHPDVVKIASEKVIVPYFDPVNRCKRRYYVDLLVTFKNKHNALKTFLIEIKSHGEATAPKKQTRLTEAYVRRVTTYSINQAKWAAADKYAKRRGWEFKVFTEKHFN